MYIYIYTYNIHIYIYIQYMHYIVNRLHPGTLHPLHHQPTIVSVSSMTWAEDRGLKAARPRRTRQSFRYWPRCRVFHGAAAVFIVQSLNVIMDNLLSLDIIQYYPIVSRPFGLTMIDIYGIYRSPISVGGVLQISQAIGGDHSASG